MFQFDVPRYEKVINDALALEGQIRETADKITNDGYSNVFFIGCGGTYSHAMVLKYMMDTQSNIESHAVIAAEFMAMGHKRFTKDSICVFMTKSGNTKEIVAAAKFCQEHGARTVVYVSNLGTPVCDYADYLFYSHAEDDCLAEAIYLAMIPFIARLMANKGEFTGYEAFMSQLKPMASYLIKAKEQFEDRCIALAAKHKDTDYHMIVGSGNVWGEAYEYAMCILEEMQWIKTKSIHAAEFFHGTIELLEEDTSMILFYGEDETRPLMDRVLRFAEKVTKNIFIFDTKEIKLPVDSEFRKYLSPMLIYAITDRFSTHLAKERNHPLETRRYYRQMEY